MQRPSSDGLLGCWRDGAAVLDRTGALYRSFGDGPVDGSTRPIAVNTSREDVMATLDDVWCPVPWDELEVIPVSIRARVEDGRPAGLGWLFWAGQDKSGTIDFRLLFNKPEHVWRILPAMCGELVHGFARAVRLEVLQEPAHGTRTRSLFED